MVRDTELKDRIFTLDAFHSNRVIPQEIIDSNNNYLITLKANQLNLYKQVEEVTKNYQPVSIDCDEDRSHGRDIIRLTSVFNVPHPFNTIWQHLKSYIAVLIHKRYIPDPEQLNQQRFKCAAQMREPLY